LAIPTPFFKNSSRHFAPNPICGTADERPPTTYESIEKQALLSWQDLLIAAIDKRLWALSLER